MDLTDGIRVFVAAAEGGSFTAAAQRTGIAPKLASKYIAKLEARLGRSLFYRTTRALSLTEAGADWLPHARKVVAALDEAKAALDEAGTALTGRLRVTCGVTLGEQFVADAARSFLQDHPAMRIDLHLGDRLVDLAGEGFDLAVRVTAPRDSTLRVRRVGESRVVLAASPAYLARAGIPAHPRDLADHVALIDLNLQVPDRWTFQDDGREFSVTVAGPLAVNSANVTIEHALAGHGIARAPDVFVSAHVAAGRLVTVLDEFSAPPLSVDVLTPPAAFRQRKVVAFVQHLRSLWAARRSAQSVAGPAPAGRH